MNVPNSTTISNYVESKNTSVILNEEPETVPDAGRNNVIIC